MNYFSFSDTYAVNKNKHRELAKKYHPDLPGGNKEIFQAVQNEWEFYDARIKEGVNADQRSAYDNIFHNVDFSTIPDVEAYYNKNKPVIDELVSRFVLKKRANRKMDDDLIKFGFSLGKSIFDLFK